MTSFERTPQQIALFERICFPKAVRTLPAGLEIELRPLTLLVGDQGAGKSTILNALRSQVRPGGPVAGGALPAQVTRNSAIDADAIKVHAQDFELENSRRWTSPQRETINEVASQFMSHGQSQLQEVAILAQLMQKPDGEHWCVIYDEPDTALSPRSCHRLRTAFTAVTAHGHQIIAAVHNPLLIMLAPEVYSVEHQAWMDPLDFLDSQRSEPARRS